MASGTLTANGSTIWVRLPKGAGMVDVSGTFGSGAVQPEFKGGNGSAREFGDAFSATGVAHIDLGADVEVRLTLADSTEPSIAWEIRPQRDV
jgi:hypothetical protein